MDGYTLGQFLTLQQFCTCTDTYKAFAGEVNPYPSKPEVTVPLLEALCVNLLDPIAEHFHPDKFRLTYGFCSDALRKKLQRKNPNTGKPFGRVCPKVDQHMAGEVRPNGTPFCVNPGASCDFRVEGVSSLDILRFIVTQSLPYDAIFFYGPDRSLHVSFSEQRRGYICEFSPSNTPITRGPNWWL